LNAAAPDLTSAAAAFQFSVAPAMSDLPVNVIRIARQRW
jgi:hypothetical protein